MKFLVVIFTFVKLNIMKANVNFHSRFILVHKLRDASVVMENNVLRSFRKSKWNERILSGRRSSDGINALSG